MPVSLAAGPACACVAWLVHCYHSVVPPSTGAHDTYTATHHHQPAAGGTGPLFSIHRKKNFCVNCQIVFDFLIFCLIFFY